MAELFSVSKGISPYHDCAIAVFAYFDGTPTKKNLAEAAKECKGSCYVGEDCPVAIADNAEFIEVNEDGFEQWFLGHAC